MRKRYLVGIMTVLTTFMLLSTQSFASVTTSPFSISIGGYQLTGTCETTYISDANPSTTYRYIFDDYLPNMPITIDTTYTVSTSGGLVNIGSVTPNYDVLSEVCGAKADFSLGTTNGTVTLTGKPSATCTAPLCPNSTTTVSINHGHIDKNLLVDLYYDVSGNVIGSTSRSSEKCTVCNASCYTESTSVNDGYTGSIYDKDGNKIGNITEGDSGYEGLGAGVTIARAYNNGTAQSMVDGSIKFTISENTATQTYTPCTTVTYTYCTEHNIWGEHYYCSEHGYCSIDTADHKYATDGSAYIYSAPCYQYYGNNDTIRVYSITCSSSDNIKVTPHYLSTVAGATIPVNISNISSPYYRARVKNTSTDEFIYDKVHGASVTTFSFVRPASIVSVLVEPVYKLPQQITASDMNIAFNQENCKISAFVTTS